MSSTSPEEFEFARRETEILKAYVAILVEQLEYYRIKPEDYDKLSY